MYVTALGLGGGALGNLYAPISDAAAEATVSRALQHGVGYFDTAPYYGYGLSEARLGSALAAADRSRYQLSTKVGRRLVPRIGGARGDQGFIDAEPFNSGVLVETESPGPEHHYNYRAAPAQVLARVERIREVCDAHGVPLPAAALQFPLHHPSVACVIPGARSPEELETNARWLKQDIPQAVYRDLRSAGLLHPQAPVGGTE